MLHVIGKLTVLRGPASYTNEIRLVCLSEDDGGALAWNYNLLWKYSYPPINNYSKFFIKPKYYCTQLAKYIHKFLEKLFLFILHIGENR
jgi:hypothetical protein